MAVTMKDVARHLGVSIQTVSAVINGKSGIGAETTEKVRRAVAELGFQPNLLAASLANGRSRTIGLFVGTVANPFFADVARGVEDAARGRGYAVILCNTDGDLAKEQEYMQLLQRYQVAGAVGVVRTPTAAWPFRLVALPGGDDRRGGYVATAHLLDLGHRRIGCILPDAPHQFGAVASRLLGYRSALAAWSVADDARLVVAANTDGSSGVGYASGGRAALALLEQDHPPTAIFGYNDVLALGALAALERAGVRVPHDVAVIGYDGTDVATLSNPSLSTIAQPAYAWAASAVALLVDELEARAAPSGADLPDTELIVRGSTVAGLAGERRCGPSAGAAPWAAWRAEEGG